MEEQITATAEAPITEEPTEQVSPPESNSPEVEPSPQDSSSPVDDEPSLSTSPDVEAPESELTEGGDSPEELPQEEVPDIGTLWHEVCADLPPNVSRDLNQMLALDFLTNQDGGLNIEAFQMLADTLTGEPGSVLASDVLLAVAAISEGRLHPADLVEDEEDTSLYAQYRNEQVRRQEQEKRFEREYESRQRAQEVSDFRDRTVQLKANIEHHTKALMLTPQEGDSSLAADYKALLPVRLGYVLDTWAAQSPHAAYVMEQLEEASTVGGRQLNEINSDPVFQAALEIVARDSEAVIRRTLGRERMMLQYMEQGFEIANDADLSRAVKEAKSAKEKSAKKAAK
jgi:hypothetical protein